MADRLALFVRAPRHGQVKTRLAQTIGADAALAAHETLVEHALSSLTGAPDFAVQIWSTSTHQNFMQWCADYHVTFELQSGADLGERMHDALARLCREGHRAIIVGSDCPSVDRQYVRSAFAALDDCDLVLGPAEDGGYGLIGVQQFPVPDVFSGVRWGSAEVLEQTLVLAKNARLEVTLLPVLWDVDEYPDWQRFQRQYQAR